MGNAWVAKGQEKLDINKGLGSEEVDLVRT